MKPDIFFTDDRRLKIHKHCSWSVFPGPCLQKEGLKRGVIQEVRSLGHDAVRLNAMLQAVEFPTSISDLASSLANVDRDALTLNQKMKHERSKSPDLYWAFIAYIFF